MKEINSFKNLKELKKDEAKQAFESIKGAITFKFTGKGSKEPQVKIERGFYVSDEADKNGKKYPLEPVTVIELNVYTLETEWVIKDKKWHSKIFEQINTYLKNNKQITNIIFEKGTRYLEIGYYIKLEIIKTLLSKVQGIREFTFSIIENSPKVSLELIKEHFRFERYSLYVTPIYIDFLNRVLLLDLPDLKEINWVYDKLQRISFNMTKENEDKLKKFEQILKDRREKGKGVIIRPKCDEKKVEDKLIRHIIETNNEGLIEEYRELKKLLEEIDEEFPEGSKKDKKINDSINIISETISRLEENFEALDKEMADLKEKKEEIENEIKTEEAKKEKSDFKTDKCICNKKLEEYQEQIKQIENDIILYVGALDFIFDESEKAKKELDDIIKELEEGGKKDLKKEAKELTPPPPPSKESSKAKS